MKKFQGSMFPGLISRDWLKGYGVGFERVTKPDEIAEKVRDAIGSRKPYLIDIPVDPKVGPLLG